MQKTMKAAIVDKFGKAGTGAYASNIERRLPHGLACG